VVVDPRVEAVIIRDRVTGMPEDKTTEVIRYSVLPGGKVAITFRNGKLYPHNADRVQILRDPTRRVLAEGERVVVDGEVWESATEVLTFAGAWVHVPYPTKAGEKYSTGPASRFQIVASAAGTSAVADVLGYWQSVVSRTRGDDPLRRPYKDLRFVHPDSALSAFLNGAPIESRPLEYPPIFPFRCNLSQRGAVEKALTRSVSVVEGPPGTGKTETILNLIANIVAIEHRTVGIVSSNNAAVDNVRDKLTQLGFGHLLASLGKFDKRNQFFDVQEARNAAVTRFVAKAPAPPDRDRLARLDRRLRDLQAAERILAERRHELDSYRLESQHFEDHLQREELPELAGLPLLKRSAERILEYLAETQVDYLADVRPGRLGRIRRYLSYGRLRELDPGDTKVVLRLQLAYYTKRIADLEREVAQADERLRRGDFDQISQEHQRLSVDFLHAELVDRYRRPHTVYNERTYRLGKTFPNFIKDYPAVLSTCHSLRASLADGHLLDYVIIDEASQVNLLLAGLVMSCARTVIVVGDQKQLAPVAMREAEGVTPPTPAYDCQRNLLSALAEVHGDALPRTLLREHYRCDPMIIGFCNKSFYDGELIPYQAGGAERPMIVARTPEGNHMRAPDGGGAYNQRELEVIVQDVIPGYCADFADDEIGVTTPFRLQVDKAHDLLDRQETDTVHRFQGRQKQVVILSTVLSENRDGGIRRSFVDDPQLVNVAVSRAIRRFILVTNNDMMPRSRHIRDLVGYIRYQQPGEEVVDGTVISVFDLLYRKYSSRLEALGRRLRPRNGEQRSEQIIRVVLRDILALPPHAHLTVVEQVLLKSLLPEDLGQLSPDQVDYVEHRASVDFVVYNRITNQALLAIEIDGFMYHENDPVQLARDAKKNAILATYRMPLLRLPTNASGEFDRIRQALDEAEEHWARLASV